MPSAATAPLNILVLCYEYPPIGGGGGVGAQQYAEAWAASGHRVQVITSRDKGLPARETVRGVDIVRVATWGKKNRATATNLSMAWYLASGFFYILGHVASLREFHAINTHFSIPTGPLGYLARRLLRIPNVLTIIGGDIYDPTKKSSPHRSRFLRAANRMLIRDATRVVAISSDTRSRAQTHYGITRDIQVINYGFIPPERVETSRAELELAEDRYYLIAVGRLVRRKGFEHLIRALRELPDDVELLLVGDGPLEHKLRTVASEAGVSHRVRFLGYRPREWINRGLSVADCFVLSSIHEGLGIVVQEAMHAGLPVVATDNGGQVDLITNGRNGFLVGVGDATALADAIRRIYEDRSLAENMSRHNREDIKRCYMDANAVEYVKIFANGAVPRRNYQHS